MRLKGSVHTKSHPEESIMEWSMFTESLTLCSRYLHGANQLNHQIINHEDCSNFYFRLINYWKSPECDVWLILLYTYVTCIVQYLCIM